MKRLILSILACLLLAAPALAFDGGEPWQLARMNPAVLGVGVACGPLGDRSDGSSEQVWGKTSASGYLAGSFSPSDSGSIHAVSVRLRDSGSPTETIQLAICTSGGGSPPKPTTSCTNADNVFSGTTGTFEWFEGLFSSGYNVAKDEMYFIRLFTSQADDTNYYRIEFNNDVAGFNTVLSSDGTTYSSIDSTAQFNYRVTTCQTW